VFDAQMTEVRFTNRPPISQIKVCKVSSDFDEGTLFSFFYSTNNVQNGSAFSVPVGACSSLRTFPDGTEVGVHENIPANAFVQFIDVEGSCDTTGISEDDGLTTVVVHPGTCVVTYDNEANGPSQTGVIEICKQATGSQPLPAGATFTFTVQQPGGDDIETDPIPAPGCTFPITVNAGIVTITENPTDGTILDHFEVSPSGAFVEENDDNRTVSVDVPVGDQSTEVIVTAFNRRAVGLVKVCKRLATNTGSAALANTFFHFDITDSNGDPFAPQPSVDVKPGSCSLEFEAPIGEPLTVTEDVPPDVVVTSVTPSASGSGSPSTGSGTVNVVAGHQTITFTNQALGYIEVCKVGLDAQTAGRRFTFKIAGEGGFSTKTAVTASPGFLNSNSIDGNCTSMIPVPAGVVTVQELFTVAEGSGLDNTNFQLQYVTVEPYDLPPSSANLASIFFPQSSHRVSGLNPDAVNPVVVKAPFGEDTIVTFYDRVKTGTVKLCKAVEVLPNSVGLKNDPFTIHYDINGGMDHTVTITPSNGSVDPTTGLLTACVVPFLLQSVPVIQTNGNKTEVHVWESGLTFNNPSGLPSFPCAIFVSPTSAKASGHAFNPQFSAPNRADVWVNPKGGAIVQVTVKNCIGFPGPNYVSGIPPGNPGGGSG